MKRLMVYTKKRNINLRSFTEFYKNYSNIIVLFSIFCSGIILGSVYIIKGNTSDAIFLITKENSTIGSEFIKNLLSTIILLLTTIFFGFSSIGVPFICLIPFIYGFNCGFTAGKCLIENSLSGIGSYALIYLSGQVVAFMCVILSTYYALNYSFGLSLTAFTKNIHKSETGAFLLRMLSCIPLCIISALLSAVCYSLFQNFN